MAGGLAGLPTTMRALMSSHAPYANPVLHSAAQHCLASKMMMSGGRDSLVVEDRGAFCSALTLVARELFGRRGGGLKAAKAS